MIETEYRLNTPVSIALLGDLHGRPHDKIIESLRANHPEIICFVGDLIYGSWPEDDVSPLVKQNSVLEFLKLCSSIAPTFFSLGNHEQMLDRDDLNLIAATGAAILDNDFTTITVNNNPLVIGGLTSAYVTDYRKMTENVKNGGRYPKKEIIAGLEGIRTASEHVPDTEWLQDFVAADPDATHIILSHHPIYHSLISDSADLILAGHLHGAQWRYYSILKHEWRGVFNPDEGFWPRYSKGVYENGRLVITAGLSNTARIPRINNPTEVVFIEPA